MNKELHLKILDFLQQSLNCDNIHQDRLLSHFNELIDELTDYCENNSNVFESYRLIRQLEFEIERLQTLHHNNFFIFQSTKVLQTLEIEKEIIMFKIHFPDLKTRFPNTIVSSPIELRWTDTKTSLVELIYSMKRSFNNGNITITQLAKGLEQCFNVELGNYFDTISHINIRKQPAKYLNSLINNLHETLEKLNSK